jgi:DnaJ-class molecular chaperone
MKCDDSNDCPDCQGTGEVEYLEAVGYFGWEGQDTVREPCETCGGSGDRADAVRVMFPYQERRAA